MVDMIEKYFMERVETHLWVLEDWQMTPSYYEGEEPPNDKINIFACKDSLRKAKNYMKMLNKYQRMKLEKNSKFS